MGVHLELSDGIPPPTGLPQGRRVQVPPIARNQKLFNYTTPFTATGRTEAPSDDFAVRERATEELADLGELAKPALEKALAGKPSVEVRSRVVRLLGRLQKSGPSADLRASRALEVLGQIGTPEVQRALKALSRDAPDPWLSQEAEAALGRMARRPPARP
jgi:hypothetical protein